MTADATTAMNQVRDLLECAWPAVLQASPAPFRPATWCAALSVALRRGGGELGKVRRAGLDRFTAAVRRELPAWDAARPCLRIVRAVFAALADPECVIAHRSGALERAGLALADWRDTRARLAGTEARMTGVLDELGLAEGHQHRRADAGRRGGDPGRDRRPGPVHRRPGPVRYAAGRWSSTPGCALATTLPAITSPRPRFPAAAARPCGRRGCWRQRGVEAP
jgi:hypothetical protein